jgi:hypothetical protein
MASPGTVPAPALASAAPAEAPPLASAPGLPLAPAPPLLLALFESSGRNVSSMPRASIIGNG